MNKKKDILVYAHWEDMIAPQQLGVLSVVPIKGKEVFSFEYAPGWLARQYEFLIDPDLQFFQGKYFPKEDRVNFGMFLDSCPDRWGRVLMDRRENILARVQNRKSQKLFESDYLLGVFDENRMGGLRFKLSKNEPFLNDDQNMAAPPWTFIRDLEYASLKLEEEDDHENDALKWVNLLLAPGSSLGGARPKASVTDTDGHLWIAKFPSTKDQKDIGGWEMICNIIGTEAGLNMAKGKARRFNNNYHTYLSQRFDRGTNGNRIHFASAMTLLGYNDGTDASDGASYLEIAELILKHGSNIEQDLEELWRRIVFNIFVKNTDDHLRNHGFLLTEKGWRLSPAYDINPNEFGTGLSLNVSENDNALDIDLALSVGKYFRLSEQRRNEILEKVKGALSQWQSVANSLGISRSEQERMKDVFC